MIIMQCKGGSLLWNIPPKRANLIREGVQPQTAFTNAGKISPDFPLKVKSAL